MRGALRDVALHYLEKYGMMAIKIQTKQIRLQTHCEVGGSAPPRQNGRADA